MITLNLIKITDHGKIIYQALNDKELDNVLGTESDYTHLDEKYHFVVEMLGDVNIYCLDEEE